MDIKHPHEIFREISDAQKKELEEKGRTLMGLTEDQADKLEKLSPDDRGKWLRKGRNRNKPCPCGSGVKFKKCCLNK